MKKFLSEAAEKIINNGQIGARSVVILPNHRSGVFLKEEIKKLSLKSIWLPEFFTIEEFIQKASGLTKADNISLYFDLFKIHQKIAGNDAKTIDEFLTWAPIMLSDFNDIDNSMANAEEIFKQLSAIKAMQQWNPDGRPLTQLQENYIHFFQSLFDYYSELRNNINLTSCGYQGFISRYLAENISSLLEKRSWNNFIIVGINALQEAEIRIFDFIVRNYSTDFIWDVDSYYFSKNGKLNNQQDAGKHIRRVINRLKINEPDNIGDNLSTSKKEIKILGVPKSIGQAKFIGQELQYLKNTDAEYSIDENDSSLINTAIVLADEKFLMPVLNSLPSKNADDKISLSYNITLGYPLNNSSVEHLFNIWIDIIIAESQNEGRIYTTYLISLLTNPIVKHLLDEKVGDLLIKHLISENIALVTIRELENWFSDSKKNSYHILLKILHVYKKTNTIKVLKSFIDILYSAVANNNNINKLYKEQVGQLIKILSKLLWFSKQNEGIINFQAIKKIGHQLISQSNISLVGEPLQGIQIMGMLETRNLDFENIYILSANEGIIPKADNLDSFIPMDIRSEYSLTLPSEKSEIYAYHFYRLLQRAKNITLLYNSDADKLGGGEKSRFILQIENELSKINLQIKKTNKIIVTAISQAGEQKTQKGLLIIEKNKVIQQKLVNLALSGYSPSSLNSYITCPLKFYFGNILRLATTNKIEQSVEANTFGTVVHGVLEEIYEQFTGKEINPEIIKNQLPTITRLLSKEFSKYYKNGTLSSGRNLLIYEVAKNYINNFLRWDIKNISQQPTILQSTEYKIITSINQNGVKINFKGIIDRIDRRMVDGTIRIIDYKTGRVLPGDLVVKNIEDLTTDPKYAKAFQVIYYAWLYSRHQHAEKLETGIISLRSLSGGFIPLILKNISNVNDYFVEFTETILKIVNEIADEEIPFMATNDTKRCVWCDYKSICNR